jgi:hypothetical protein
LGTQQSPTRIIQIDVTRFVRETGYFLPDATSEGADTAVMDVKRNVLWIGTLDPLSVGSTAITIKGAGKKQLFNINTSIRIKFLHY